MRELLVLLGRADVCESLESSWEDLHATLGMVDSLEVFITGSSLRPPAPTPWDLA